MAINQESLIGSAASRPNEAGGISGAKPKQPAKTAAAKKLAVAKLATAKLSTAKLALLRKIT
jgi:hypothetical protein